MDSLETMKEDVMKLPEQIEKDSLEILALINEKEDLSDDISERREIVVREVNELSIDPENKAVLGNEAKRNLRVKAILLANPAFQQLEERMTCLIREKRELEVKAELSRNKLRALTVFVRL